MSTDKTPAKKAPARRPTTPDDRKAVEPEPAEVDDRSGVIDAGLKAWHEAQCVIDRIEVDLARDDLQPRVREELEARRLRLRDEQADARKQILGK